jgi:hypothetical protein
MKKYRANAVVRWAVHPEATGRLELAGAVDEDPARCPEEKEIITRPFLVDPVSKSEVPVRIVQVLELLQEHPPVLAVLVTRDP